MKLLKPHIALKLSSWEAFVVKSDAPVMRATASTCCAGTGVAEARAGSGPGCCAPKT